MNNDIEAPRCPYCNKPSKPVTGEKVYPHRPDLFKLKFYECEPCEARVGCHKNSGKPLGRLANAELRRAKQAAHKAFDPLWKDGPLKRTEAYKLLAQKFNKEEIHIGELSVEDCAKVIQYSVIIKENSVDQTGYDIDLVILNDMKDHSDYWMKSYKFVMDMQSMEHFTAKQAMWLQEITSNLEDEYNKVTGRDRRY